MGAENGPVGHHVDPLCELSAALIRSLDRVRQLVRQRMLGDLAWEVGRLGGPHSESAPKAVNSDRFFFVIRPLRSLGIHAPNHSCKTHIRQCLAPRTRKHEIGTFDPRQGSQ